MSIKHIPCGPYANESERGVSDFLRERLSGLGSWILLSNLAYSAGGISSSDEIDLIAVGPSGVHVIEIKHWDFKYLQDKVNAAIVEAETDKLTLKVKKLAGRLRKRFPSIGYIQGKFLLTRTETSPVPTPPKTVIRGCRFFKRKEWREMLELDSLSALDKQTIEAICQDLAPRSSASVSGDIRRLGNIINLELISDKDDRFHRIYRGQHASRRDRMILHLYDYSGFTETGTPEKAAMREFETLQRLQKSPWLARIMDSFQAAPEYPGELFYFSVVDPAAPSLELRSSDEQWSTKERIHTAAQCAAALYQLHNPEADDCEAVIHRNLSARSIRIRANGNPIFTELNVVKLADASTVGPAFQVPSETKSFVAPEVLKSGLSVADKRSDVYSLCASLRLLFLQNDELAKRASQLLDLGLKEQPEKRIALNELSSKLKDLIKEPLPVKSELLAAIYWDEETEVLFNNEKYRVVGKLGSGGFGTTFKVLHLDKTTGEEFGTYVGKVIHKEEDSASVLFSHKKARPHTSQGHLSVIHEVADEWKQNQFVALMKWIEGVALSDLIGVLPIYAEDIGERSCEQMVLRWLFNLCGALSSFHRADLTHGDVSPRNIIVSGGEVTLTDYDLVTKAGNKPASAGTVWYSSPTIQNGESISLSDDIFALGASMFHVLFDQEPFKFNGVFDKRNGVNWENVARDEFPIIAAFIDRATSPEMQKRFASAQEALSFLHSKMEIAHPETNIYEGESTDSYSQNEVPWLKHLLSFPGSPYGNLETRGLDSEFAEQTYVDTALEEKLVAEIKAREVKLVILSGNAGDGKTAFLQYIGQQLELPAEKSSKRIWDQRLKDGLQIRVNLDGSAAFQGKSSIELLDEFFKPFQEGKTPNNLVHLVAINSGPLQAWILDYEERHGATKLTEELWSALEGRLNELSPLVRFIDLNNRSLVGGLNRVDNSISTTFLDRLINKMLGGEGTKDIWKPCLTCTAKPRCQAWNSVEILTGDNNELKNRVRTRLYEALQAVHQRGEVHITARELRATLSYILFGVYYCSDLHAQPETKPPSYYDLAFSPTSPHRQGDVLKEFTYLDPALEAHAQIDRYLVNAGTVGSAKTTARYSDLQLASARRRAFFEWSENDVEEIAQSKTEMHLARGRHLSKFLRIGLMSEPERNEVCRDLCVGISKLIDLPLIALQQHDVVPIRISPRTRTESAFWVNKPQENFSIEAEKFKGARDLETLHTHIVLSYRYGDGNVEQLTLNTELFNVLMDLKAGYQMMDSSSDDTFANLAIFTQRLAQENQRTIYAWNPVYDKTIFEIEPVLQNGIQKLVLKSILGEQNALEQEPALEAVI
jgi:serine/threonine protein kinase